MYIAGRALSPGQQGGIMPLIDPLTEGLVIDTLHLDEWPGRSAQTMPARSVVYASVPRIVRRTRRE